MTTKPVQIYIYFTLRTPRQHEERKLKRDACGHTSNGSPPYKSDQCPVLGDHPTTPTPLMATLKDFCKIVFLIYSGFDNTIFQSLLTLLEFIYAGAL